MSMEVGSWRILRILSNKIEEEDLPMVSDAGQVESNYILPETSNIISMVPRMSTRS